VTLQINYLLILTYTLLSAVHYLDAQTVFVTLSLVNILRGQIVLTPFIVNGIMQVCRMQRVAFHVYRKRLPE